jgi:membrane protein implicated in regulation of membrane protease activity
MPFFNFSTFMAFLAWFGGTGYLLRQHTPALGRWIVLLAAFSGLVGASVVFLFIAKFLLRYERDLDPADYDKIGVIGRVTNSIREGGTGEIVFEQEGTRNVSGARSDTGTAIAKGTEVVITRYERGIAYVRRWEELESSLSSSGQGTAGS